MREHYLDQRPDRRSSDITISGPGANTTAVSGDNADAVFQIGSDATVSISGLTIEKAKNAGILTVTADTPAPSP